MPITSSVTRRTKVASSHNPDGSIPNSRNFAEASSSTKLLFFQSPNRTLVENGVTNIAMAAWPSKRIMTGDCPRSLAVTSPEGAASRIDSSIESYLAQAVTSRLVLSL